MSTTLSFYEENALELAQQYDSLVFETVHHSWSQYWPRRGASVLDIGAGSGRDANWFATQGCKVVAVEPCDALRKIGLSSQIGFDTVWLNDSLPALQQTLDLEIRFDVILLSAVWMHVRPTVRSIAIANLCRLLQGDGILVISLRHGEFSDGRKAYPVSVIELEELVNGLPMRLEQVIDCSDKLQRLQVNWQTVVISRSANK